MKSLLLNLIACFLLFISCEKDNPEIQKDISTGVAGHRASQNLNSNYVSGNLYLPEVSNYPYGDGIGRHQFDYYHFTATTSQYPNGRGGIAFYTWWWMD